MEIAEAEQRAFEELESNYRQGLISKYHDLVQMGTILKKDPVHKQIMHTAHRLQSEEDNDLSRDMTKPTKRLCAQRRLRSSCASAQSDQSLRCALSG